MFCPTCGQPATGNVRFCTNCGTDLTTEQLGVVPSLVTGAPAPMAVPNVSQQTTAELPAAVRPAPVAVPAGELRGVGGWLLVFCIWVTIIDPLMDLRLLQYLRYVTLNPMLIVSLMLTAYGVFTGIQTWMAKPHAIKLLRVYFALVALVWAAGIAMYFVSYAHMPGLAIWSFLLSWLRVAGFLAVWVSYFRVSQRVRNTYGANLW